MTRVDRDKYSVLIRGDYLYNLGRRASTRPERDKLIQEAVENFIVDYTFEERGKEIYEEQPRVGILSSVGHRPNHRMYLEFVKLPDGLVNRLETACRHPVLKTPIYDSLGTVLNTAIRMYLTREDTPLFELNTNTEDVLTKHA